MPRITKKLTKWLLGIGLLPVLSGISFSIGNWAWYRTRTWSVVDKPLELKAGSVTSQEFTVNVKENFIIQLEVDRGIPSNIAFNVLGTGEIGSDNRTEPHGFKMRWAVMKGGKLIKEGFSDGNGEGYWSSRIGRVLGFFPAEKGEKYRINLDVLEDGSALDPYHPTLKVQVDLFTLDGYAMGEGFSELAGMIVAGIGALLLIPVLPIWGWLITKKEASSPRKQAEEDSSSD
jgi:hypothetical protein